MPYENFGELRGEINPARTVESENVAGPNLAISRQLSASSLLLTPIQAVAATVAPTEYPLGYTVMFPSSDTSWPEQTGLVETYIYGAGGTTHRIRQTCTNKTGTKIFHRFSPDGLVWDSWQLVTAFSASTSTTTQYEIDTVNVWETVRTLTFSTLPTVRFDALVVGGGSAWARNSSETGSVSRVRIQISRDGGTVWGSGVAHIGSHPASGDFVPMSPGQTTQGSVTGTIQVRMQARSTKAATHIDDIRVEGTIYGIL